MKAEDVILQNKRGLFAKRWFATIIDNIAFDIPVFIKISLGAYDNFLGFFIWWMAAFIILQYFVFEPLTGFTLGKFILRIKVVKNDGSVPGIRKGLIRTLFRFLEVNPLFFGGLPAGIMVLASDKKQRLGDIAAKTYVLHTKHLFLLGEKQNIE